MPRTGHIALAGAPNVGKSTLLNSLVGAHLSLVSPKAQATRLPVVGLVTEDDTQYILHDLPGLLDPAYLMHHRMLAAAHELIRKADVILHLHPAPDAPAPPFTEVARLDQAPAAPVLTVYTKGDKVEAERRARLQQDAIVVASDDAGSTKRLLGRVRDLLPERDFEFEADDIGTQPLRFFVTEYIREAAFEFLEDELPYAIAAEVEEFREGTTPVYIRATVFVERESQKGIVLGRRGSTIRALGTHARARIEALLGAPVYLDLWVKVLPRWRKNARELTRFGFPLSAEESA
ncbi:MAG TPA: GTPase Era [Gemmatimonadales bacterium]|nr:GTPase Era [Gemmatimonadales bacterium]